MIIQRSKCIEDPSLRWWLLLLLLLFIFELDCYCGQADLNSETQVIILTLSPQCYIYRHPDIRRSSQSWLLLFFSQTQLCSYYNYSLNSYFFLFVSLKLLQIQDKINCSKQKNPVTEMLNYFIFISKTFFCIQKDISLIFTILLNLVQVSMICHCFDITLWWWTLLLWLDSNSVPGIFCGLSVTWDICMLFL